MISKFTGRKMMKIAKIILGTVALVFATTTAQAYSTSSCLGKKLKWDSNSKTLRSNTASFPTGYWYDGVKDGVAKFNLNPSKFRYSVTTESGGVGRGNGQSEIWGWPGSEINGAPAVASSKWSCYWFFGKHVKMKEVDIIFNFDAPWRWTANTNKEAMFMYRQSGGLRPLQTTLAHELGHGLRLNHVNYEYNVMGTDFEHIHVNDSNARAYMGEDTTDGIVALYGVRSGGWEDIAVAHWRYSGASGEYSDHRKTRLFSSSGGNLPTFTVNNETGYRVTRGQTVRAEFTYENNGKNYQDNVKAGYYISTNDYITTSDQRVGGSTFDLGRNQVYTTTKTLTIPNNLSTNRNYWLGVVIDEDNAISEAVGWNNATYIPIRVAP